MKKYYLENLDCANCAAKIEATLRRLPYVNYVSIDFSTTSMLIETEAIDRVKAEILTLEPDIVITEAGKQHQPKTHTHDHNHDHCCDHDHEHAHSHASATFDPRKELLFLCSYVAAFVIAFVIYEVLIHYESLGLQNNKLIVYGEWGIFGFIYLIAGWSVIKSAVMRVFKGDFFDENFLMTIATLGAFCINEVPEAAGVMVFFKIGEYLQELSVHRSRKSIKALLEVRPDFANVMRDGEVVNMAVEEVSVDEVIVVKPGERVPLDGLVISGKSQIDTSALTGESVPRTVKEEDGVMAGTINMTGLLTVRVIKPFTESSIVKILELVENATHKKAKTEMFFTQFARVYTPIVVGLTILVATIPPLFFGGSYTDWVYRALVCLVISCPCALVVSIPLTYFGAIGGAAKKGILVKGSVYLDSLNSVTQIVFDKTGTLTKGVFKLTKSVSLCETPAEELLQLVAQVEAFSNHPIANVFVGYDQIPTVDCRGVDRPASDNITNFTEIAGHGISAQVQGNQILIGNAKLLAERVPGFTEADEVGTIVYLAIDLKYAGYFVISDEIKEGMTDTLQTLRGMGIHKMSMLTGDSRSIAQNIAKQLGLTSFHAELLPEGKVDILTNMIASKPPADKVMFVGDGINDAPVLAMADIGITMGGIGTDAAIETADVVIMNDNLAKIPQMIKIAKKTRSIIYQNITFALGIKLLFVVLSLFGLATMWEAVFADVGVTLLAVVNARRASHE